MSLEEIVLVTTLRGIQRLKKEYFTKCNSQDNCTSHLPRTHAHVRVSHVDKVGHVDLFYPMIENKLDDRQSRPKHKHTPKHMLSTDPPTS